MNSKEQHIMRPSWTIPRYNDDRLNLSNNVCYDTILIRDINKIIKNNTFNLRQYPNEFVVYNSISKYHNIPVENISIGYGLGELIIRVLKLDIIKKISIISPTWQMVEVYSKIFNIEFSTELDYTCNTLYIANPSGMTGKCLSKTEIIELLSKFEFVIVDEAYSEFAKIESSVTDLISHYENLIVLKTFSKSLGLAGIRLGYCFSNDKIIHQLQTVRPSGILNSMLTSIIDELFCMIPAHVYRMKESRTYLENKYSCIESNGNYVLMLDTPNFFKENFLIKDIPNIASRITLADIDIFKNAESF